jgi:polyhydroxybutyrate depolymerase
MTEYTLKSGGLERRYVVYIPTTYSGKSTIPMIMSLHGFAGNPRQQSRWSAWNPIAERETILMVYPQGTGFPLRWYSGSTQYTGADAVDDVRFISDLITEMSKTFCVDSGRVYMSGLSNGGGMSYRAACEMSDRIAAIAGVAGAYSSELSCTPTRPVPVIAIHGDGDPVVRINGTPSSRLPAIKDYVADWAKRNSCQTGPTPIKLELPKTQDLSAVAYSDCAGNADVHYYIVKGGGHIWPGGVVDVSASIVGNPSEAPASEIIWNFFKAHPLPQMP